MLPACPMTARPSACASSTRFPPSTPRSGTPAPSRRASAGNPFLSHAFLKALEDSKSVGRRTGWQPQYLLAETDDGTLQGAVPLYVKGHSQGEYIFDHGWAQAFERAGGRYYPEAPGGGAVHAGARARACSPRPGPLRRRGARRDDRHAGQDRRRQRHQLGARDLLHARPTGSASASAAGCCGSAAQYHWSNAGYKTFDDFLGALASRKRKAIRKEREAVRREGLAISALSGAEIKPRHWDAFFAFYMDTGGRKWGTPYLTRSFFDILGATHGRQGRAGAGREPTAGRSAARSTSRATTRSTAATGAASRTTRSCISRPATTRRSTTRSRMACSASRPAPRAITRSSAAICRCRPTRRTGSSIPASAAPSTTTSSVNGPRSSRRSKALMQYSPFRKEERAG